MRLLGVGRPGWATAGGRMREARVVGASTGLSWQLMKAPQPSEHNWLVLYQNLQKLFAFLAGPRAGLWLVWGRGLGAQGNRSPDLHPEAIFPGSFLPHSGSLPWSWIRPFQPSHPDCTAQPALSLLGARGRLGPAAEVSSYQAWLLPSLLGGPLRWRPEMAQVSLSPWLSPPS